MGDEFQVATTSKSNKYPKHKRVFIGNLSKDSFASPEDLQAALEKWMGDQIPDLTIHSIEVMNSRGKDFHALVDCGTQANQVIRSLHQKMWQGRTLNVQREQRTNTNTKSNGNQPHFAKKPGFGGKGWSAPRAPRVSDLSATGSTAQPNSTTFTKIPIDQATNDIQSVVEEEFKRAEDTGEDPLNVAIASTAAATFLAAMGAFGDDEPLLAGSAYDDSDNDNDGAENLPTESTLWDDEGSEEGYGNEEDDPVDEPATFQMKPMSELMAEFGQQDPNWKLLQPIEGDNAEGSAHKDGSPASTNQLAPKGKAPIHIVLTSFGFSKGAPKRMDGWSYRQPLLPLDCRDFPTVPHYLAWQDGLSGSVKRALQYPPRGPYNAREGESSSKQSLHDYAVKTVAPQVFEALLDAQNQGGHGYVSPLEMTIYVGSDLGRHRSVVVCEWAAIRLRKMLRNNANGAVHQPVSIGTIHRDLEGHRHQHYNLKSGTAGVNDRQGRTLKKKQMELAGDW
jgi:hypothetical protein